MKDFDMISLIAFILVLVGGINWGLYGITGTNLIQAIFGDLLGRLIFIMVGAAAGWLGYQYYLVKFKKA